MKGGNLQRVCEMTGTDGSAVRVEPYAIYTSGKNKRYLYFYQLDEPAGWKNMETRLAASVILCEQQFTVRQDYNPLDKNVFPTMHFSIPTHDGRQRWVDLSAASKKSALPYRPNFEA